MVVWIDAPMIIFRRDVIAEPENLTYFCNTENPERSSRFNNYLKYMEELCYPQSYCVTATLPSWLVSAAFYTFVP